MLFVFHESNVENREEKNDGKSIIKNVKWNCNSFKISQVLVDSERFIVFREYSTYRVVTTSRLKAPRHLVVLFNLKTFTKYSKRSVYHL